MLLSESELGQQWTNQFNTEDITLAKFILDNTLCLTLDRILAGITSLIEESFKDKSEYIALYPVRDVLKNNNGEPLQYWVDDDRFKFDKNIGSEAEISHLIRDICKRNKKYLNQPNIEMLRNNKCHKLLFINDINCSGSQIIKFSQWLYDNPTIKSWMSSKIIRFYSLEYASTVEGHDTLEKNKLILKNYYSVNIPTINTPIFSHRKTELINFFNKYRTNSKYKFGFKNTTTFILLSYKNPNNNPAIFFPKNKNGKSIMDNNIRLEQQLNQIENKIEYEIPFHKYDLYHNLTKNEYLFIVFLLYIKYYGEKYTKNLRKLNCFNTANIRKYYNFAEKYNFINDNRLTKKTNFLLEKLKYKSGNLQLSILDPEEKEEYYSPNSFRNPS